MSSSGEMPTKLSLTLDDADQQTILSVLLDHVHKKPDHQLFRWINNRGKVSNTLTYRQLWDQSRAVASLLESKGVQKGDRVMITYPFGLDFLPGLFGCMLVGAMACSVYPPNPQKLQSDLPIFNTKVRDAGARFALTTLNFRRYMIFNSYIGNRSEITWLSTDGLQVPKNPYGTAAEMVSPDDVAFIQYTSGSTGFPKGVMISHRSLIQNVIKCSAASNASFYTDPDERSAFTSVSWLPQYHDMGLIGFFFTTIFAGIKGVVCSPLDFILKPILWHDAMVKYKAKATLAPNFSFGLLTKRLQARNQQFDKWTFADRVICGAEPVDPEVMNKVLSVLGVSPLALYAGYGLAEVGLAVYFSPYSVLTSDGLVACGDLEGSSSGVCILNQDKQAVEDGSVGQVYINFPNQVALGYWGNEKETRETFHNQIDGINGDWLATGDLGKIVEQKMYITGRMKEVIILNGRNYYPVDVERTVEKAYASYMRPGCVVAVQYSGQGIGLIADLRKEVKEQDYPKASDIVSLIARECEAPVEYVCLLKTNCVPKTTSGKIMRIKVREMSSNAEWPKNTILMEWRRPDENRLKVQPKPTSRLKEKCAATAVTSLERCDNVGGQLETPRHSVLDTSCQKRKDIMIKSLDLEAETFKTEQISDKCTIVDLFELLLGADLDMSKTWFENGLTSLTASELINRVQEDFLVSLPSNFEQLYPTPETLKAIILNSERQSFRIQPSDSHPDYSWYNKSKSVDRIVLAMLQMVGIVVIIFLFGMSLIPSFYVGKKLLIFEATFEVGRNSRIVAWNWLPLVIPTFFVTLSFIVFISKWLVVGAYRPTEINLQTWTYLRWWFVDRLLHMWELFVGHFILETKMIWVFYRLLGADIHYKCSINAFIREFDLVSIGAEAKIEHQMRCRKFRPWTQENPPSLLFRPIIIGKQCIVSGIVSPGARVGDRSRVLKHSAIVEGACVPCGVIVKGSPAYNAGNADTQNVGERFEWLFDTIKLLWQFVELYHFFALFLVAQIILNEQLPLDWRYTPLLYWFLILQLTSILGLLTSIILKWLLIGRRCKSNPSIWCRATNWICDFHFRVTIMTLMPFCGKSKLWNAILYLHGLDIDIFSHMNVGVVYTLAASKVNSIKIHGSFVSNISLDLAQGDGGKIEIVDSSIGYDVQMYSGVHVIRSVIPPRSTVTANIFDSNQGVDHPKRKMLIAFQAGLVELLIQLILNSLIFCSFIPAYEVFMTTVYNVHIGLALLGISATFTTQASTWILLSACVEATYLRSPVKVRKYVFAVCINHAWTQQMWNMTYLLHGSPFFSYYLQWMGARVEGELWCFDCEIFDARMLHFADKTIVDCSHVTGHFVVYENITIEESFIAGLLHPGCYANGGSIVENIENGPSKVLRRQSGVVRRFPPPGYAVPT